MDVPLHIIEPCGFPFDDKKLRRVALDYYDHAKIIRHRSWHAFLDFCQTLPTKRLILLTTKAKQSYTEFVFEKDDVILLGRESSGVPEEVKGAVEAQLTIPMATHARSLNVALAASMVLGEALRQTRCHPERSP